LTISGTITRHRKDSCSWRCRGDCSIAHMFI